MNFLAHVNLSHGNGPLIMGNLIADAYKGNKHQELNSGIQQGVLLHRKIDYLTDTFKEVVQMKRVLSPYFGRYSGIALDVYFDHFLSLSWKQFNSSELNSEILSIHALLENQLPMVNEQGKQFIERLIQNNWLGSYYERHDLSRIFNQMSTRFNLESLKNNELPLEKHFFEIQATFNQLYPFLIQETKAYIAHQQI